MRGRGVELTEAGILRIVRMESLSVVFGLRFEFFEGLYDDGLDCAGAEVFVY